MSRSLYPVIGYYYKSPFSYQLCYVLVDYENDCYAETKYSHYNFPFIKEQKSVTAENMSAIVSTLKNDIVHAMKKVDENYFFEKYS